MRKKYWLGGLLSAMVIIGGIAMVQPTLAAFMSQDNEVNNFKTGDVNIEVQETFPECKDVSKSCTKEVWIKNESFQTDAVIRVAIVPYWQDGSGNAWPGDVSEPVVKLQYSSFVYEDYPEETTEIPEGWVKGEDGYYYYTHLLKAQNPENDEDITKQILESVEVNIPDELQSRYEGKTLVVDVKAEAVQPTWDAIERVWPNLTGDALSTIEGILGERN